jgi:hypothetical protein
MKNEHRDRRIFSLAAASTLFLLGAVAPAIAQQGTAATPAAKWRPKDGTYGAPSADFKSHCGDFGDLIVDLAKNSIDGNEWGCDVTGLTDTAPGTLRIDMTCNDYNLAEDLDPKDPAPENRKFKEVMYLKKVDEKSMIVRKSSNGKLADWGRVTYCPAHEQRIYIEAIAHNARERAKAAEGQNKQGPWRPQDGVYATQGANFDERCLKAGDAIIRFSERVISDGSDRCARRYPGIRDLWSGDQPGRPDRKRQSSHRHVDKPGNPDPQKDRLQNLRSAENKERQIRRHRRTAGLLRRASPKAVRAAEGQAVAKGRRVRCQRYTATSYH